MRYLLCILTVSFLVACNNSADKKAGDTDTASVTDTSGTVKEPVKDTSQEYVTSFHNEALTARIQDTLMKLPFVKKTSSYIDSFSHHQHTIAFVFDSSENGISVMAGYNGPERFETYYNFTVDPSSFAIKVADDVSGEMLSIKEYIRSSKKQ